MKFINQLEYPDIPYITRTELEGEEFEKGKNTTIKTSGCGLCCAVMVADLLIPNCDFDLKAALEMAYATEANHRIGTSYKRLAPAFTEKLSLKYENTDDPQRLLSCLRTGGVAVVNVQGDHDGKVGVFSHVGHYITVFAQEEDGRLAILDPAYAENRYEEEGRKGKVEVKNGFVALCSLETLMEDTRKNTPAIYLFWRK